ncbi:ATP-dependent zinc protease [Vreelandella massiliensis]|uniref:ATP-dependent zinc protease family protein n=1 Tax=Vreelandella massiliensis TaxID=1816686 RepID=UPI00096A6B92|nr:ATP-dependent zinc protease [Halomonas massiliensis]MYL24048.1 ATP-dependent zinc protease [Halomonas alkaliantarctica]
MRHGFFWLAATLSFALTGCASLQPNSDTPPPLLTEQAFHARINTLSQEISAQCDSSGVADQTQRQHQALTADVREVGSLLRHLRQDIQTLEARGGEPVIVREECETRDILDTKTLLGRNEWVGLPGIGTYLKARIDSGANTSSLSAQDVTRFERDGEDWVRFKLALNDDDVVVEDKRDKWIEAPIERRVRVIQATNGEGDSRPVISLLMTLGPIRENVEFTLNDRSHLSYPVLLGRRFLLDIAIIDVAETYVHPRPEFPGGEPTEQSAADEAADQDDNEE